MSDNQEKRKMIMEQIRRAQSHPKEKRKIIEVALRRELMRIPI